MRTHLTPLLLPLFLLVCPQWAEAGSFRAAPIKIFFDAKTKTTVLKVTNDGGEKVTVQLEAFEWLQDEAGKEQYNPTKDIIFFPKIADIAAGEEKIIRVGYQGQKVGNIEKTYRLFLQELPVSSPGEVSVKMAIRMGLPVFVEPEKKLKDRKIIKLELADGSLSVTVKNAGNSHFVVGKINVKGLDESQSEVFSKEKGGWYVLAGASKAFPVDLPKEDCLKASKVKVEAEAEKDVMTSTLAVDKALCADKPKPPMREALSESDGEKE
ncbi:MAG: molecular chaperone [Sideroxydans sp.]|nr:molecular chaperone [Sideroxydans sp.]